ncbi:MAG: LptF/LptG family permease [Lewinellaceae bacterium]|nr:LptF/LptG family permease [Lewinellaceae bacterium]
MRTNFRSWTKVWDMREFEMVSTDKDRIAGNRAMLSMNQLRENIDSLNRVMESGKQAIADDLLTALKRKPIKPKLTAQDSLNQALALKQKLGNIKAGGKPQNRKEPAKPALPVQVLDKPLDQYTSFDQTFRVEDRPKMMKEAHNRARGGISTVETRSSQIENRRMEYVKTGYELYAKYSFALVCFIFLFIGAPMGAIIRKGGFGYPILVSIIFFVTFIMLIILCRKLAEGYLMTPFWAAMVPCIVLIPIGVFLTRKAMNDSAMFSTDRLDRVVRWIRNRRKNKKTAAVS